MPSIHSSSTDNGYLSIKVGLRKRLTKPLGQLRVLDLFAGRHEIWDNIPTELYTAVEIQPNKHPDNIVADNRKLIPTLDLSEYNVIDLDTYGVPAQQIELLMSNKTRRQDALIFYTMTDGITSAQNNTILEHFDLKDSYRLAPFLFNHYTAELFHAWLHDLGVTEVHRVLKPWRSYHVEYGCLKLPKESAL